MSQTIEIHTKQKIETNDLYHFLQDRMELLLGEQKSEDVFYFYQDKKSIRGVYFSKETYGYELRLTILSSNADRQIAFYILIYFINFVREATYVLESETTKSQDIMERLENDTFTDDAALIKTLVKHEGSPFTFYGPKGEFYIGPMVLQKIQCDKEGWEERLQILVVKVQYELPPSESDTVLEMGDEEEKKILKLVNREVSYVLKKYDYLIFTKNKKVATFENMIFITNEILNQHLPENWSIIDEYTIVAPALTNEEYNLLIDNLLDYDCNAALQR